MNLTEKQIQNLISVLFALSPLIMIVFMINFIYPDRALYQTPAEVLRVVLLTPTIVAVPYFIWRLYLRVRYIDVN